MEVWRTGWLPTATRNLQPFSFEAPGILEHRTGCRDCFHEPIPDHQQGIDVD
jgi:hypothetical protein